MKIAYVSKINFPSKQTNALSIMKMCQAMHNDGHEVTLFAYRNRLRNYNESSLYRAYGIAGGFTIITVFVPQKLLFFKIFSMYYSYLAMRKIKKIKANLIYSRLANFELGMIKNDLPIIYEMHSLGPFVKSNKLRNHFIKLLYSKSFKRIIVTTELIKASLTQIFQQLDLNVDIKVARLSADYPITISDQALDSFKKDNMIDSRKFNVGYTGVLKNVELRGIPLILEMAEKLPLVDFHIVGGDKEDLVGYDKYFELKNLIFHGYQQSDKIPYYLLCFNAVLSPLRSSANSLNPLGRNMSPLKISQYLAYSKVIIASNIPQHSEIIKNGENGILVDESSVDEYVSTIEVLMKMEEDELKQLSSNALKTYNDSFTPNKRLAIIFEGLERRGV